MNQIGPANYSGDIEAAPLFPKICVNTRSMLLVGSEDRCAPTYSRSEGQGDMKFIVAECRTESSARSRVQGVKPPVRSIVRRAKTRVRCGAPVDLYIGSGQWTRRSSDQNEDLFINEQSSCGFT